MNSLHTVINRRRSAVLSKSARLSFSSVLSSAFEKYCVYRMLILYTYFFLITLVKQVAVYNKSL